MKNKVLFTYVGKAMLIGGITDIDAECKDEVAGLEDDVEQGCRAADELFEIMTMSNRFDTKDEDILTASDLVFLYQNMDIGTQLMSHTNKLCQRTNQHVETVIYQGEEESTESELSEVNSDEDVRNMFQINSERLDFINKPSYEETLCQKHGYLKFHNANLKSKYNKRLLFDDPYIKGQLRKLNLVKTDFERSTLLDYISCKRLEDNYNFNMENIIQYVKHTIDQLKRISNGDYLTEKTRRKWRQNKKTENNIPEIDNKMNNVLTNAISVPIHVEKKISKKETTWDELVHSEVDLTSLCKILEKKVVIEIPKLLSGSYNLFSKCCTDSVIIRCKKQDNEINKCDEQNPQVDVVFQLQRSKSGHLLSNISSIMILQKSLSPALAQDSNYSNELIPLPYKEIKEEIQSSQVKIVEIEEMDNFLENEDDNENIDSPNSNNNALCSDRNDDVNNTVDSVDQYDSVEIDNDIDESSNIEDILQQNVNSEDSSINICEAIDNIDFMNPNELMVSMQQLNVQSSVPEENEEIFNASRLNLVKTKRKSPVKTRIKSPYENKSLLIEERKRRRLLEIRERRERKKMALTETCKMVRNKYGKGAPMAQASSSVTKLSITNKSFYNSIFGESATGNYKNAKTELNRKEQRKDIVIEIIKDETKTDSTPNDCDDDDTNPKTEKNPKENYLDEAVTAVMCVDMDAPNTNTLLSDENSIKNNPNFDIVNNFTGFESDIIYAHNMQLTGYDCFVGHEERKQKQLYAPNIVPMNSPTRKTDCENTNVKSNVSLECRRSIDKIYNLMKDLGTNSNDNLNDDVDINSKNRGVQAYQLNSTVPGSDSGTSLKHQSTSSNPSSFSFDKVKMDDQPRATFRRKHSTEPIVPKVVISSKLQVTSDEYNKERLTQRDRKLTTNLASKSNLNNPLKAISQLLHEFENVKKTKAKATDETKTRNSMTETPDFRNISRQGSSKRRSSRLEPISRESTRSPTIRDNKSARTITRETRDRSSLMLTSKFDNLNVKHSDKIPKSMIGDIIDEAKEARGEAVRGPSKGNFSRINALAQPRKLYVQAHSEEFHNKYGRNLMTDRLQRLASAPQPPAVEKPVSATQNKLKTTKRGVESASPVPIKHLEKLAKPINRRNRNSSPEFKTPCSSTNDLKSPLPKIADNVMRKTKKVDVHLPETRKYDEEPSAVSQKSILRKSRVPIIPNDVDCDSSILLSPTEDSSSLGVKLHKIVRSMVNKDLTDLPDFSKSTASSCVSNNRDETFSPTFSVLNQTDASDWKQAQSFSHIRFEDETDDKEHINSSVSCVSSMAINNVTLPSYLTGLPLKTEKCNSIVEIKSSRCLQLHTMKDDSNEINMCCKSKTLLNMMPFSNVPLQVTTVGYAFPGFSIIRPNSIPLIRVISNHSPRTINKLNKLIQVVTHANESREQALQTHFNPIREIAQIHLNESCQTEKYSEAPQTNTSKASSTTCKNNFDSASSLDVLVNLLNEIQNITTCQTQMTSTDNSRQSNNAASISGTKDTSTNTVPKVEVATNKVSSVHKLDSETSIYSLYVSKTGNICDSETRTEKSKKYSRNVSCSIIPIPYSDKQISADIGTEVQIQAMPSTVDHVSNVSNSMLNMFSQPSSQSVFRYQNLDFDLLSCRKIIEIPTTTNCILRDMDVNYGNDVISKLSNKNNFIRPENAVKVINCDRSKDTSRLKVIKYNNDPLIRVKRDILVTVYSVLVFTVFAALSFPEFLHQGF